MLPVFQRMITLTLCFLSFGLWQPEQPPTVQPPQPADPVQELMETMTLRQMVGQLFVVRPQALDPADPDGCTTVTEKVKNNLTEYPVGGIILFADNIVDPTQLETLFEDYQQISDIPLLTAVDEEGGTVARLASNRNFETTKYASAAAVAASGDPEDAKQMGRTIGSYLKRYGFHLDFAPVADVNTNPQNPIIGKRAFSSDPQTAAEMVAAAVQGFHEAGVLCTLKHFPGHGDTATDSHLGMATTAKTWAELQQAELIPFEAGIAAGADVIMAAHITTPNITGEDTPASLSYTMLTEKLRGELGFEGVICTDALEMQAITDYYTAAQAAVQAINAGADILLIPADLPEAFEGVIEAVLDGTIPQQRLEESVYRILTLKQKAGLL